MSTDTFRRYLDLLNEAETGNTLQDLIKPRTDGGNYIDPKTGIIMYVPRKNPRAGSDAPDPTPKPFTWQLLRQPEAQDIKNALKAAGLDIISVDSPSLIGSYPVAAVNPDQLAQALASTSRQNAEIDTKSTASDSSAASRISKKDSAGGGIDFRTGELKGNDSATDGRQLDRSAQSASGGAEDGPGLAGNTHCAQCGTPKSMHQGLKHSFVAGDDARPEPVSQTGDTGSNEKADRIRDMQTELKKAGAELGTVGPDGNGIDGVIGKVTQAAMAKYPDIAKKYPDLVSGGGENKETKVSVDQLRSALNTIEGILSKYKINFNEHKNSLPPADQMKNWRTLMEASPTLTPAQQAAQRAGLGMPRLAGVPAFGTAGAEAGGRAAAKAAGKIASKFVIPGVGTTLSAYDAYSRWNSGDKSGAVIAALAGAGWLIPGPLGWVIGGGLDAANLARDSSNRVAISNEDAKIIRDNLPIIVSWQSDPINAKNPPPGVQEEITRVLKALKGVGIESARPAAAPGADEPQSVPSANANLPALNQTLDRMDQLLKKNNFESMVRKNLVRDMYLLNESEQMALRRNLLKEDWSWSDLVPDLTLGNLGAGAWLYNKGRKHGLEVAQGAARGAGDAAAQTAAGSAASGSAASGSAASGSAASGSAAAGGASTYWNRIAAGLSKVASGAKTAGKWGLILGAAAAVGVVGKITYDWAMANPEKAKSAGINPDDVKQLTQLAAQLKELQPQTDEEFSALPPDVQQKIKSITDRMTKMNEQLIKAVAQQQSQ